eukprot:CAMPEP_0205861160 /NCGR_PEP_ID=MMETSP1083-20121108/5614_1 /ASSEMBLY_ACC=CAM_ASM_000430 /TAXON_ID=97485 /ORGANISM="Prymnesium parvum, Strain Texoma1" /LENGTH=118 /DNA_ID=CAMNT_0053222831 /DNA_START=230 /DNA_END=583 /DNA_ORIENTATION=+
MSSHGPVETYDFAIQVRIEDDSLAERGELCRFAKARRERDTRSKALSQLVRSGGHHRSFKDSRRNRAHAYAERRQVARHREAHPHDGALGRRVRDLPRLPVERGDRRGVDDTPALPVG